MAIDDAVEDKNELVNVTSDLDERNDKNDQMQDHLVDVSMVEKNLIDLNDDCLIRIFEHLRFIDWIHLCLVNERFHTIIRQNIVNRYFLNFSEIKDKLSIRKVFKLFKNDIVKMSIRNDDIQYKGDAATNSESVLQIIKQYCSVKKLRELSLFLNLSDIRTDLLEDFAPMLSNIQILRLCGIYNKFDSIFPLLSRSDSLKVLQLKDVDLTPLGGDLSFSNLETLVLEKCTIRSVQTLNKILIKNTNLKSLKYFNNYWCSTTNWQPSMEALKSTPNLEELVISNSSTYYSLKVDCYSNILNLNHLKSLQIVSYQSDCSDIYGFVEELARKNTVENLVIEIQTRLLFRSDQQRNQQNGNLSLRLNSIKRFEKLTTFEIINPVVATEGFLISFTQALPNLKNCTLRSESQILQSLVIKLVSNANKLTQLTLVSPRINLTKTYYSKLWNAKLLSTNRSYFELHVSSEQKEKFFGLNAVYNEKVVKISSY